MEVNLKKESIKVNELIKQNSSEVLVEGDIIVPDSKPDVLKICQIDAKAVILSKEVSSDRITISGHTIFNIMYIPEPSGQNNEPSVRALNTTIKFIHIFEVPGAKPECIINCSAEVEHVEFNLINSRKLNVKSVVFVTSSAYRQIETDLVCDISGEHPIEMLKKPLRAYCSIGEKDIEMVVTDRLEVPAGKPCINEILKVDSQVKEHEIKVVSNKIICKGAMSVSTLYLSDDKELPLHFMEHEIAFTEIIELEGVTEGAHTEIDYAIKGIYHELGEDSDGDIRILGVEIVVEAIVQAAAPKIFEIVSDCYCPGFKTSISRSNCNVDYVVDESNIQTTVKNLVSIEPDAPEISRLYNLIAKPFINETRVEKGRLFINGTIDAYFLYLTDDTGIPIHSHKAEIDFSHAIDFPAALPHMIAECRAMTAHASYSLSGGRDIDARITISLDAKIIENSKNELISDLSFAEEPKQNGPSLIIYFADYEETLWQIAKKYATNIKKITDINKLEENQHVTAGMQIIIPC